MLLDGASALDVSNLSPDHSVAVEPLLAEQTTCFLDVLVSEQLRSGCRHCLPNLHAVVPEPLRAEGLSASSLCS